jgi:hypothetical protein
MDPNTTAIPSKLTHKSSSLVNSFITTLSCTSLSRVLTQPFGEVQLDARKTVQPEVIKIERPESTKPHMAAVVRIATLQLNTHEDSTVV